MVDDAHVAATGRRGNRVRHEVCVGDECIGGAEQWHEPEARPGAPGVEAIVVHDDDDPGADASRRAVHRALERWQHVVLDHHA